MVDVISVDVYIPTLCGMGVIGSMADCCVWIVDPVVEYGHCCVYMELELTD